MNDQRSEALAFASQNKQRFLDELKTFVSFPSISTDSSYKDAMEQAASWVAEKLRNLGMDNIQTFPTKGHPVVYGESKKAGPQAKTVLIYGHYDVQPAEPLDKWHSAPFVPEIKEDYMYGRGVSDMKGQVLSSLKAIEAILHAGKLPVNVKFMIEGEEEIGSPNLGQFIREHKDLLACDIFLNPDTGILGADKPSIVYALRGLAYFELRLYGAKSDLHSGLYGGVVHNPAQVICELIAGMHNDQGRVTLPGFYDRVQNIDAEERAELARLGMDDNYYVEQLGVPALWEGEKGYTATERIGARPTLEINGLYSGYTGEGSKTVIANYAMAKISTRLVPNQDPEEVHQGLVEYLKKHCPPTVNWELSVMAGSPAALVDRNSEGVAALAKALESVWGKRPLYKREGGSVPVVVLAKELLGAETVNSGFGLPDDGLHGPDERLHLPTFYRGIDAFIHFFMNLG